MIDPRERELFSRLVALPATDREPFLEEACQGDGKLRHRLRRLLEGHDRESALGEAEKVELPTAPHRIGPYFIGQRVGEGGMGTVYEAEQRSPIHRRVALKVIKPGMDTREVIARFEAERQALALMSHPNIAAILDAGATDDGRPYFVMEYVAGEEITDYCNREKLTIRQRLQLFLDICDAVQHAHQKGIIHRDLKPNNILVAIEAGRPVPKVIDFGIAKAITTMPGHSYETQIGVVIGTPTYMSPEQADHAVLDVDTRSDVYALGMVLYELLCGDLPFDEGDLLGGFEQVSRRLREMEFPRPSNRLRPGQPATEARAMVRGNDGAGLRRELRGDLDAIALKALEKDRGRRYGSAAEFAEDLNRFLNAKPVRARPDHKWYKAKKLVVRHKTAAATTVMVLLVLVAGIVVSLTQARRARQQRDLALMAQQGAEDMSAFLVGLLAPSSVSLDDSLTLRTLAEMGVELAEIHDLGPIEVGRRYRAMAQVKVGSGAWEEAAELLRKAIVSFDEQYPEGHPETARALILMAHARRRHGQQDNDSLLSRALEIQREWLGESHPDLALTYEEMSRLAQVRGKWPEIIDYQQRAVEIFERAYGDESHRPTEPMARLAQVVGYRGDYPAADSLNRRVIAVRTATLGPHHPATLSARLVYADFLFDQLNRHEEAAAILRDVLTFQEARWGRADLMVSHARSSYATVLALLGRTDEALELSRYQLDLARRLRGPTASTSLGAMYELAGILHLAGRFRESHEMYRRALALHEERGGGVTRAVVVNLLNYGRALAAAGNYAEAESVLVDVVRGDAAQGLRGKWTAVANQVTGRMFADQGRFSEARPYYLTAAEIMDEHLADGSMLLPYRWAQDVYRDVVWFAERSNDVSLAEKYRSRLVE